MSAPASQPLTVPAGGASALGFTATASSTGNWLVVSPTSGTTPGTVNVSINTAGLSTGTYTGTILVAGSGGAPGFHQRQRDFERDRAAAHHHQGDQRGQLRHRAPSRPARSLLSSPAIPTHPIGPATPAGLTLDSNGKVSTTIGGVQVTVNGFACPDDLRQRVAGFGRGAL